LDLLLIAGAASAVGSVTKQPISGSRSGVKNKLFGGRVRVRTCPRITSGDFYGTKTWPQEKDEVLAMSVRNGKFQLVGDEQKLSHSPQHLVGSNPPSGKFQMVGDVEKMSDIRVNSPSAHHSRGDYQKVGDEMKLSRKAVMGWGSAYNLPVSHGGTLDNSVTGVEGNSKTGQHGKKE
jgi:hypothetical protein